MPDSVAHRRLDAVIVCRLHSPYAPLAVGEGGNPLIRELSPELELAIACCRFPPGVATSEAIAAALAKPLNWPDFLKILRRHRIVSLANFNLARSGHDIPADVRAPLAAAARDCAATDLIHAAETARLQREFDEAGLPALFLKGATTGVLAYGALGVKQSWDIDLLTTEPNMIDAMELLQRRGYRLVSPAGLSPAALARFARFYHEAQLRDDRGITVELHWRLFTKPVMSGVSALSETQVVRLGDRDVRTLRDDLLIVFLIGHGQEHGWSRLKWLADLNAMLSRGSVERIEGVYGAASALGLGQEASAALLLCARLFELALPLDLAKRWQNESGIQRLVAVNLDCIAHPMGGSDLPSISRTGLALLASRFRTGKGWKYLLGELRSMWTQPIVRAKYPAVLDSVYHALRVPTLILRLPFLLLRLRSAAAADHRRER
jgi:hypothetical protein